MITPFTEVIFIDGSRGECPRHFGLEDPHTGGIYCPRHQIPNRKAIHEQMSHANNGTAQVGLRCHTSTSHGQTPANVSFSRAFQIRKKEQQLGCESMPWECVVWAAKKANDCEGDTENEQDDTDSDEEHTLEGLDGTLKEDEKEAIRSLSLSSPLLQKITVVDKSDEEASRDSTEESGSADDVLAVLRDSLERLHPDSLRHRQLKHMLGEEERKRFEIRERAKKRHEARKAALREKGVSSQSAELLPTNPDSATPSPIQRELQRYIDDRNARQEQERREKVREAFEGHWLRSTEKELHDCVKSIFTCVDPEMRKSLTAYREVLEDKLKNHHRTLEHSVARRPCKKGNVSVCP